MNPDRTTKTRSVWPTLRVKIAAEKSGNKYAFLSQVNLTAHGMFVNHSTSLRMETYSGKVTSTNKKYFCQNVTRYTRTFTP